MGDPQARYAKHLLAQGKTSQYFPESSFFQTDSQLWDHAAVERASILDARKDSSHAHTILREEDLQKL